jgi:hypothetical protein
MRANLNAGVAAGVAGPMCRGLRPAHQPGTFGLLMSNCQGAAAIAMKNLPSLCRIGSQDLHALSPIRSQRP